jgi:hypothetical protein
LALATSITSVGLLSRLATVHSVARAIVSIVRTALVFGEIIFPENTKATTTVKQLDVPVQFSGIVTVKVPDHLSDADAKLLAGKLALARILATSDNPDAPEDDACEEYADECSALGQPTAEQDWDQCEVSGVGGQWSLATT